MPALERLLNKDAVIVVLQQEVIVRLENISTSGCLLTAPRTLRVGAVGRLRIVLDDVEFVGAVRVVRSQKADERSWNVGVERLWVPVLEEVRDAVPEPLVTES